MLRYTGLGLIYWRLCFWNTVGDGPDSMAEVDTALDIGLMIPSATARVALRSFEWRDIFTGVFLSFLAFPSLFIYTHNTTLLLHLPISELLDS